ncbi:hypothetical protein CBI38_13915 [Rhodococcus oxybenzonivorans]|uniref:Secreted protein n=1 Tax=Rhodococcus oxybenzonivorans TaxID=1990687 RepID=A0A2S2BV34_9NOCA|nr:MULTISPECIES: hypothetical protein [Rhodococcus]AWK72505.1 hypothetical protein CBI38_13915 [Rhodococcus oxybenzonivorans]QTJ64416.1 hypothetical protein HYG77_01555 [Rhodococcus sp. ZPP]
MFRSTLFRRATMVLASAAVACTLSTSPASAQPLPDAARGIGELQALAAEMSPVASNAVNQLLGASVFVPKDVLELGLTTPQDFMYPSPTLGCGVADEPATVTLASAQAGPNLFPPITAGQLRFQAIPAYVAIPQSSDLSVAWINLNTFQGGIVKLDDRLPIINTPLLSKIVDTGAGTVLGTMFGTVSYPGDVNCTVVPTVGTFTS